jgi:diaminohydroxyphosphoribosylaminopyrimidine deaminase/5-amino-6-(5-phosphoribosylamino)uracil reductase
LNDEYYMRRALRLARRGMGRVSPNPLVGAVVVNEGDIVGEGAHLKYGEAHAEIAALRTAGEKARGAALYVNLEPCCHHGKTPPCTDAIIKAGIQRVVIGMVDPNPMVNRRGADVLKAQGIAVSIGVLEDACADLNRAFVKFITTGRPYITAKIAMTMDGRIASKTGHSKWITSRTARTFAHRLRAENDAVLVGLGTVRKDDPSLTVRHTRGVNPYRIVLDENLQISPESSLLNDDHVAKTIIATTQDSKTVADRIIEKGAQVWYCERNSEGLIDPDKLVSKIAESNMPSVLIEGGAAVNTSFLKYGLIDRLVMIYAPKILGEGISAIGDLNILSVDRAISLIGLKFKRLPPDIAIMADVRYQEDN